jgi:RNA polymerase sigma-70 factor, ECF subfamily
VSDALVVPLPEVAMEATSRPTLEDVFRDHHAAVASLCRSLCRSQADADDAVQETFLAVHFALPSFRGHAQLSTWIHRIALRCALAVRTKRGLVAAADEDERVSEPHGQSDARLTLDRALARLPADHRAVLALFAVEGLSHREIAEILNVPEGTVWSRLHHARRRLIELLGSP